MTRQIFHTMEDLEDYFYGANAMNNVMKADDPYLTTTTGIYNPIYGQKVWVQLNMEKNLFAALPKQPWSSSGWRVITARGFTLPTGGVAEDGAIPDTDKATYAEIATKPKTIANGFDASELQQFLSGVDDALDPMAQGREFTANLHAENMNKMLLTEMETAAGNNLESIDRIISSYDEVTNASKPGGGSYTANRADIYGLDRDAAATWADAYVSHGSGSTRNLSLELIDDALTQVRTNGGNTDVIITGWDTLQRLQALLQAQRRFGGPEEKLVIPTFNGIKGAPVPGYEGGFVVATYQGIPIIPSKDATQDTLSRMYFIDSRYLHLRIAKPTQYFETGVGAGNPFTLNKFSDEGVYRTMAEPICTFFKAQAKLRDLK